MKRFVNRILLCLAPVVIAAFVVAWAYNEFQHGRGGFRLGVDLAGGTILVYEVDETKMPPDFKAEDLAAALKRRIDPADLYNITIRPVAGTPPRVEIILPTGGRHQAEAEERAWQLLLQDAAVQYPIDGQVNPYEGVPKGNKTKLIDEIVQAHPDSKREEVSDWVEKHTAAGARGRLLTSEEVENIKSLIEKQGRLEFRILANRKDDEEATTAAEAQMKDPKIGPELERLEVRAEPPPPPRNRDNGSLLFTVKLSSGGTEEHSYSWVELGKSELYSLGLNSDALARPEAAGLRKMVEEARQKHETFSVPGLYGCSLYSRRITDWSHRLIKDRDQGKRYEYFVLVRDPLKGQEITGDYLVSAREGQARGGAERAIDFSFNTEGGNLFYDVTSKNKPDPGNRETAFKRHLAIIFDGQIASAPTLNEPIRTHGQITGRFTQQEVQDMVRILRAGALPATLKKEPVSQNTMGATLGEDTIHKGTWSVLWAFVAVMAFMVFYYRFAGLVACLALLGNLLLTVAFMVLVQAAFTLPGLAGLVLMLGMAVDANVLIYERLREERDRGANLALALRNGYDRAFPTIIDTHLSSIFTAIVLYVVGNDQLKGFGISLTVGLIISLFTSLYMTRTMFELWLAKGWMKDLRFFDGLARLIHARYWDFMAIRYYWFTGTVVLTVLGAALFIYRFDSTGTRSSVLNIDFIGGTAYTAQLAEPMNLGQLRNKLEGEKDGQPPLPDLAIEQIFLGSAVGSEGKSAYFTIRTSERSVQRVQEYVNDRLGEELKRVNMHAKVTSPTEAVLTFTDPKTGEEAFASPAQVSMLVGNEFAKLDLPRNAFQVEKVPGKENSEQHYSELKLKLNEPVDKAKFATALQDAEKQFASAPQPERLENFDRQLAANTQERALYAILASWAAILLYLWFRFGSWTFGAATVLCLIHDLFFTLGAIAACHYVYTWFPTLSYYLGIADFKIDLPSVAALLTLIGYSVSDTIVVFDRIREVRGKNPLLTPKIINDSVNQTLTRTILSSTTVWLVVIVLYIFGGEGVHLFAFVMVVGVIVGTYSSIYIASPLLLIFGEGTHPAGARVPQPGPVGAQG